jgi:hypothetical protein
MSENWNDETKVIEVVVRVTVQPGDYPEADYSSEDAVAEQAAEQLVAEGHPDCEIKDYKVVDAWPVA